jgi:ABC-type nickel/cobalt efflux system permease component RcnA
MKRPWTGFRSGINWGLGHASGVLFVGAIGVVLRSFIDIEALSRWAEFVVGFVLIGVGVWAISQMRKVVVHKHPHRHKTEGLRRTVDVPVHEAHRTTGQAHALPFESHLGAPHEGHLHSAAPVSPEATIHAHLHVHTQGAPQNGEATPQRLSRGSFLVGLVHGAAGTGHLLGVVPTLSLPPLLGAVYLAAYGVAAVVAMGAFGFTMGTIGNRLAPELLRRFMFGCGALAIGLGMYWLHSGWRDIHAVHQPNDPVFEGKFER